LLVCAPWESVRTRPTYPVPALAIPICPLSSFAPELELAQLLGDAGITELFVDSTLLERALAAARAVGLSEQHVHILEGVVPGRPALGDVMARVAARGVTAPPIRAVDADTLAYLLFSSGTSGRPKAVAVTHANLVAYVIQASIVGAATAMALPVRPGSRHAGRAPSRLTMSERHPLRTRSQSCWVSCRCTIPMCGPSLPARNPAHIRPRVLVSLFCAQRSRRLR
jgi:acyl-CoA synthetase (AMP-forming)/AMP-acid ligase II